MLKLLCTLNGIFNWNRYWMWPKVFSSFSAERLHVNLSQDVLVASDQTIRRWKDGIPYVKMFHNGSVIALTVWELQRPKKERKIRKISHILRLHLNTITVSWYWETLSSAPSIWECHLLFTKCSKWVLFYSSFFFERSADLESLPPAFTCYPDILLI